MQSDPLTRRDLLATTLPAAAILGAGLGAFAQAPQQTQPQAGAGATPPQPGQVFRTMAQQMYSNGQHTLPPLPYAANALEPNISAEVIEIHHDKHHQAYVDNLNKTLTALDEAAKGNQLDQMNLAGLMRDLTYNAGGHMLHSLYWVTMAAPAGQQNVPQGEIADAVNNRFGSFDLFKALFTKTAVTVKGNGWAVLIYSPITDRLSVFQVGDHDRYFVPGMLPILPVDAWEHAYYLQYQNKRADYVNAWWNVVNWPAVNDLFTFFRQQNRAAGNMQT